MSTVGVRGVTVSEYLKIQECVICVCFTIYKQDLKLPLPLGVGEPFVPTATTTSFFLCVGGVLAKKVPGYTLVIAMNSIINH